MCAKKMDLFSKSNGNFLRVLCPGCKNEQVVFSLATTRVNCLVCNQELAVPGPSKIFVKAKLLQRYE